LIGKGADKLLGLSPKERNKKEYEKQRDFSQTNKR
jgi:hypothetical protein